MELEALFGGEEESNVVSSSLARLAVEDGRVLYLLLERGGGGGVEMTLTATDGKQAWGGSITGRRIKEMAKKVKMEEEEFERETLKALTREQLGTSCFAYTLNEEGRRKSGGGGGGVQLAWKKHLVEDNIKFQLGSVTLDPKPSPQVNVKLLEHAIATTGSLGERVGDLQKERQRLVGERQQALSRLERLVNVKEEVEKDLFAKFKLVLNDKKAKIRHLMEELANSQTTTTAAVPGRKIVASRDDSIRRTTPDNIRGGTDDEMASNDNDDDTPPPRSKRALPSLPATGPRPSHSILGGDEISLSPPVKRRRRESTKKAAGVAEIPRPPSLPSRVSQESRTKVRATSTESTGSSSKKSEGSLDSDELLGLL